MDQSGKPVFQLLKAFLRLETLDLFRLDIAVGQLHHGPGQLMIEAVEIAVAHGLSHVDLDGFVQIIEIHVDALDLVDGDTRWLLNNAVGPALHQDLKLLFLHQML